MTATIRDRAQREVHGAIGRVWHRSLKRALIWIIAAVLAFALASLGFLYFSPTYHMYVVKSESMTPALKVGDMVIVGPPNGFLSHEIKPGSIVTYRLEDDLVTHRVQSFDGETLVTKGDAVEEADPQTVPLSQVVGVVFLKLPKLGLLSAFLHTTVAWSLVIGIMAIAFLVIVLKDNIKSVLEKLGLSSVQAESTEGDRYG